MLEARGVVSHDVGHARDEGGHVTISVQPLMDAGKVAEPRGRAELGQGAFGDAGHRRSVVGEVFHGGVLEAGDGGHDCHQLCQEAGVFEVAVGHAAVGTVGRH